MTETGGKIQSPSYSDQYKDLSQCVYTILSPAGTTIELTFTTFVIEQDLDNLYVSILLLERNLSTMEELTYKISF